jgi:hypothetical protein
VASVVVNANDVIQFINIGSKPSKTDPTLLVQAGDWETGNKLESGVAFDVSGDQIPILTAANARKLAQWLNKAADWLDGVKPAKKKHNKNRYEDEDDTDEFLSKY